MYKVFYATSFLSLAAGMVFGDIGKGVVYYTPGIGLAWLLGRVVEDTIVEVSAGLHWKKKRDLRTLTVVAKSRPIRNPSPL